MEQPEAIVKIPKDNLTQEEIYKKACKIKKLKKTKETWRETFRNHIGGDTYILLTVEYYEIYKKTI